MEINTGNIRRKFVSGKIAVPVLTWMEHGHLSLQLVSYSGYRFVSGKLSETTKTHKSNER
jgi:hypothetical protein